MIFGYLDPPGMALNPLHSADLPWRDFGLHQLGTAALQPHSTYRPQEDHDARSADDLLPERLEARDGDREGQEQPNTNP